MPMPPPLMLMLIDGLGYDFVTAEATPNLSRYAGSYAMRPLRPALGYSDCQRAVLFCGLPPDRIGYWMLYRFARPSDSPWRELGRLAFLDGAPVELPRKGLKLGLSASLMRLQARRKGYSDLTLHNIPFRALPWHAPTLRRPVYAPHALGDAPTVFDLLREAKRPFAIVRSDTVGQLGLLRPVKGHIRRLLSAIRGLDRSTSFVYFYLHTPDMFAHRHGIRGPRFWEELKEADQAIATIIEAAKERLGPDTQVVLTSDHGMDHTERFVSFRHLIMHPAFGKDYVAALDSTMVRLWYLTPDGARKARPLVESSGAGGFLTLEERRTLGVDFPGEQYGDDVYLLRPGASIYPNYHSVLKPLAMHAYHPSEPDQRAVALFIGDRIAELAPDSGELHMADILPIIRSLVKL